MKPKTTRTFPTWQERQDTALNEAIEIAERHGLGTQWDVIECLLLPLCLISPGYFETISPNSFVLSPGALNRQRRADEKFAAIDIRWEIARSQNIKINYSRI